MISDEALLFREYHLKIKEVHMSWQKVFQKAVY